MCYKKFRFKAGYTATKDNMKSKTSVGPFVTIIHTKGIWFRRFRFRLVIVKSAQARVQIFFGEHALSYRNGSLLKCQFNIQVQTIYSIMMELVTFNANNIRYP